MIYVNLRNDILKIVFQPENCLN